MHNTKRIGLANWQARYAIKKFCCMKRTTKLREYKI